jgi:hypothetical protein
MSLNSEVNHLLYSLVGWMKKDSWQECVVDSSLLMKNLPYYGYVVELGKLVLSSDEEKLNSKNQKLVKSLSNLMGQYSVLYQPMYLTPKELWMELPNLPLGQVCKEVLWLSGLYS